MLFVRDELSYDRHDPNTDRIYRVAIHRQYPNGERHYANTPKSLADVLSQDYPEIKAVTRFRLLGDPMVRYEEQAFLEDDFFFAESNFFDVFTIPFRQGDPKTALREPGTMVITESIARKYFGDGEAMGKTLATDFGEYTVTGVMEDITANAHVTFKMLVTLSGNRFMNLNSWVALNTYTYLLLKPGTSPDALAAKFPEMVRTNARSQIEFWRGAAFLEEHAKDLGDQYFLQPLSDIHLRSLLEFEIEPNGDITYVYLFGGMSLFILFIACINFMNLATARATNRIREVGMRKVLGAQLDDLYKSEQTTGRIIQISTGLAILIACMGLLGLVGFITEQRTKEIGIRKVMGASVGGIVVLLLENYIRLIVIAFVIAMPIAYYIMDQWLQDFVYRTEITPVVFMIAAALTFLIVLLTVGYHSIRAARSNPIDTLRYE
jgi:putative ABC transport system permease protein